MPVASNLRFLPHLLGASALTLLVSCGGQDPAPPPPPADMVLKNGYVYTVDATQSVAQAVAVREGRIVYVGQDAGAQAHVGGQTRVIDLGGRMLMPGLVDGHIHPMQGGAETLKCSLEYLPLTVAQMRTRLQACLDASKDKEPGGWLEVVSWDRQAMSTADRDPVRADLDSLTTQRPIVITSIDHHTDLVNSRALALAGITAATPNPAGGSIIKDALGQPTGILEDAASGLVSAVMPQPTDADRAQHARIALDLLRRQGVTSFMSAISDEDDLKAFSTLARAGELTARPQFAMRFGTDDAGKAAQAMAAIKAVADRYHQAASGAAPVISVRHVKLFMDGVLQAPAQTAGLLAPYKVNAGSDSHPHWVDGGSKGPLYLTDDGVKSVVLEAAKAGFDPHVHAIGDAAVRRSLDAFAYTREQLPNARFRPAIAHAELVDPADYPRFKLLDAVPVMSFQWAQQAPYSVEAVKDPLGPERYARMEPEGSLFAAGATIAYGSDWPVDPMAYFYNLSVGVTRRGQPTHWASFGPAYAGRLNEDALLSRATALRSITLNAAYQLRMDAELGSIEVGKLADMIVLDRSFMTAPEEQLGFTAVLLTMVGGRIVWADAPFAPLAIAQRQATKPVPVPVPPSER